MAKSLSVLVVDDSRIMRRMVVRSLSLAGLELREVHEASDGNQALALLRGHKVDLVCSDIHMPGLDGIGLVEEMAKDPTLKKVPIVMVSTERSVPRMDHLQRLGVRGYLHKPFTPEQMRETVHTALIGVAA